jgi:hypothetical protein
MRPAQSEAPIGRVPLVVEGALCGRLSAGMSMRTFLPIALVAAGLATAGPASAQTPTDNPVPGAQPGACTDTAAPTSGFTRKAARKAGRKGLLRGTARDVGCGVDRVAISVQRKQGKAYKTLFRKGPLLRKLRRGRQHWIVAHGTAQWSFRLPKRLPRGKYVVRTRAIDFAGNVEKSRVRRLRLR